MNKKFEITYKDNLNSELVAFRMIAKNEKDIRNYIAEVIEKQKLDITIIQIDNIEEKNLGYLTSNTETEYLTPSGKKIFLGSKLKENEIIKPATKEIAENLKEEFDCIINKTHTKQSVKEMLNESHADNKKIKQIEIMINNLHSLYKSPATEAIGKSYNNINLIEDNMIKLIELKEGYNEQLKEYHFKIETILNHINKLSNNSYQAVLIARHINYLKWKDIAISMQYAESHIYKIYNKAIEELTEILNSK